MSQHPKNLVIAIDGPAGAGKSTIAREIARQMGYLHIDSGAMYRAFTVKLLREGINPHNGALVSEVAGRTHVTLKPTDAGIGHRLYVDGIDVTHMIREPEVSQVVPIISQYPAVRARLVEQQRLLAMHGGVVMDGRDIGTVVLPNADVKVFLTASLDERALRRQKEMAVQGISANADIVAGEIAARDTADSSRPVSPLIQAADAYLLDTTNLPIQLVVEQVLSLCMQKVRC